MSYSPEGGNVPVGGKRVGPSLESLVEISLPFMEADMAYLNLTMRLAELHVFDHVAPSFVLPRTGGAISGKLFISRYNGEGANSYHDVRRVVVTRDSPGSVTVAHDWIVDLNSGVCAAIESRRPKRMAPTAESGPSIMVGSSRRELLLAEGVEYANDLPKLVRMSEASVEGFMADTATFVGGYTRHLDMSVPSAYVHKFVTTAP